MPPGLAHDNPGNSKSKTPPKFNEKTPRESTQSVILGGRRKKQREILDLHPSGATNNLVLNSWGFSTPCPFGSLCRCSCGCFCCCFCCFVAAACCGCFWATTVEEPTLAAFDLPKCFVLFFLKFLLFFLVCAAAGAAFGASFAAFADPFGAIFLFCCCLCNLFSVSLCCFCFFVLLFRLFVLLLLPLLLLLLWRLLWGMSRTILQLISPLLTSQKVNKPIVSYNLPVSQKKSLENTTEIPREDGAQRDFRVSTLLGPRVSAALLLFSLLSLLLVLLLLLFVFLLVRCFCSCF